MNPDPQRFDGILLPFQVPEARAAVNRVLNKQAKVRDVTLAEVMLHDGQRMLAFNDLFIGVKSHVSLAISCESTGEKSHSLPAACWSRREPFVRWMSSVFNMAAGVARSLGAALPEKRHILRWEGPASAVGRPGTIRQSHLRHFAGCWRPEQQLQAGTRIADADGGVIFSDGIEADFLEFNSGAIARIGVADQRARLVVK